MNKLVEHLRKLSDAGMSQRSIEVVAGVPHNTVSNIVTGKVLSVSPERHEALQNVRPVTFRRKGSYVDSRASQRRLGALMVLGWTLAELGRRYEVNPRVLARTFDQTRMQSWSAVRISKMFDDLSATFPPKSKPQDITASKRAQKWAMGKGYHPPMFWEGRDIRSASLAGGKRPHAAPVDPHMRTRVDDVDEILRKFPLYTPNQVADSLGITYGGLHSIMRRSGRDDLNSTLRSNGRRAMVENAHDTHRKMRERKQSSQQ